jgi:hypothetical protein
MAMPLEHSKFIYGFPLDSDERVSLFKFCQKYKIGVQLYAETTNEAQKIIKHYESDK